MQLHSQPLHSATSSTSSSTSSSPTSPKLEIYSRSGKEADLWFANTCNNGVWEGILFWQSPTSTRQPGHLEKVRQRRAKEEERRRRRGREIPGSRVVGGYCKMPIIGWEWCIIRLQLLGSLLSSACILYSQFSVLFWSKDDLGQMHKQAGLPSGNRLINNNRNKKGNQQESHQLLALHGHGHWAFATANYNCKLHPNLQAEN